MDVRNKWFILMLLHSVSGYSAGPPDSRCTDAYPHHAGEGYVFSQTGEAPFEVVLSSSTYEENQEITVTVQAKTGYEGLTYKGLLIRARRPTVNADEVLGAWKDFDSTFYRGGYFYAGTNEGKDPNCVKHLSSVEKQDATFTWTAPNYNAGTLHIGGTFLQNFTTFYAYVETPITFHLENNVPTLEPNLEPEDSFSSFKFNRCGKDYGCLKSPGDCNQGDNDCDVLLSWRQDPDDINNVYYEMVAKEPDFDAHFVALGWSHDKSMGEDDTVSCVSDDEGRASIHYGFNVPRMPVGQYMLTWNDRYRTVGFSKLHYKRQDGLVYCSFSRPAATQVHYFDLNQPMGFKYPEFNQSAEAYHLMVAFGESFNYESPGKHSTTPKVSANKIHFTQDVSFEALTGETITVTTDDASTAIVTLYVMIFSIAVHLMI